MEPARLGRQGRVRNEREPGSHVSPGPTQGARYMPGIQVRCLSLAQALPAVVQAAITQKLNRKHRNKAASGLKPGIEAEARGPVLEEDSAVTAVSSLDTRRQMPWTGDE